ncbi:MAG: enoyl-CoA hydratase-related protein, partial [Catalinimonas sp.]
LVGSARAFELATLAPRVPAPEAAAMGLINRAVPADQLDAAVAEVAGQYAAAPTRAIGMIKRMLHHADLVSLEEALEYEAQCQEAAGRTEDHREGVRAFLEKRRPRFVGR